MLPAAPWTLTIDGVPYQVGVTQLSVTRPLDTEWLGLSFTYTAPAETARVVLEVT